MVSSSVQTAYAHVNSPQANVNFIITQVPGKTFIEVQINKLEDLEGGYPFHIHKNPLTNGNCDSAGGHYDPKGVNVGGNSTQYKCKMDDFSTCEQGDLSGKFGVLKNTNKKITFVDYTIDPLSKFNDEASIVIHKNDANKTKVGCSTINIKSESTLKKLLKRFHLSH